MGPKGESSGRERGYGLRRPLQCTNFVRNVFPSPWLHLHKQLAEEELTGDYPLLFFQVPTYLSFSPSKIFDQFSLLQKRFLPIFIIFCFLPTAVTVSLNHYCFLASLLCFVNTFHLYGNCSSFSNYFFFFCLPRRPFSPSPSLPPTTPLTSPSSLLLLSRTPNPSSLWLLSRTPPHLLSVTPQQRYLLRAFQFSSIASMTRRSLYYDVHKTIS